MAWSYCGRLKEFMLWPNLKGQYGVYEIGFRRGEEFSPVYIGISKKCIFCRLGAHWLEDGSKSIAEFYEEKRRRIRSKNYETIRFYDNLWFRYMGTYNLSLEGRNLRDFGYGQGDPLFDDFVYKFNRKGEEIWEADDWKDEVDAYDRSQKSSKGCKVGSNCTFWRVLDRAGWRYEEFMEEFG